MKKYLFVALLAMMCLPSMAQRVALRYGMNITLPQSERAYGSTLGQSLGLTYEQSIKGRFAISAGAYLTDIAIGTYDNPRDCFGGEDCPEKMRYTYRFFQVPVNLVWNATPKGITEWQFLVNGGYVFTQWVSGKSELFYGSTTATVALEKLPKAGNYPGFWIAGLESRRTICPRIQVALGTDLQASRIFVLSKKDNTSQIRLVSWGLYGKVIYKLTGNK